MKLDHEAVVGVAADYLVGRASELEIEADGVRCAGCTEDHGDDERYDDEHAEREDRRRCVVGRVSDRDGLDPRSFALS